MMRKDYPITEGLKATLPITLNDAWDSCGGVLPDGLRISTHCPIQRIREWIDAETYGSYFPLDIGIRGKISEAILAQILNNLDVAYQREVKNVWITGGVKSITHLDFVLPNNPAYAWTELKSTNQRNLKTPNTHNIHQIHRQNWATNNTTKPVQLAYIYTGTNHKRELYGEIVATYTINPNPLIHAEIDAEMRRTGEIIRNITTATPLSESATYTGLECRCSNCFKQEAVWLQDDELIDRVNAIYYLQDQDVSSEIKELKNELKECIGLQPGERRLVPATVPGLVPMTAYISLSKAGQFSLRFRDTK